MIELWMMIQAAFITFLRSASSVGTCMCVSVCAFCVCTFILIFFMWPLPYL
jgi:hypothetical protein